MPLHLDPERSAIRSVIETAEFAADQLATMRGDRKDSDAGKACEAENRLRALRSFLFSTFPELEADAAAPAIFAALPLGEFAAVSTLSKNGGYGDYGLRVKVETWADALKVRDLLEPFQALAFNTTRYRSSVVPDARWPDPSRPARDVGERVQAVYSWVKVDGGTHRVFGAARLCFYVQTGEGAPIISVEVEAKQAPFSVTASRREFRGGFRYEGEAIRDPENALAQWPQRFKMWSTEESVSDFTCL